MTLHDLRAARHGVSGIRLFGSFAGRETRNDGRLDLLVLVGML